LEIFVIDITAVGKKAISDEVHGLHIEFLRRLYHIFNNCFIMIDDLFWIEEQRAF
jgi:hypothetical protein